MSSKKSGKGSKTKKSGKPQFQDKEYDVSMNGCCLLVLAISSCGFSLCTAPYDSKLLLGSEEGKER